MWVWCHPPVWPVLISHANWDLCLLGHSQSRMKRGMSCNVPWSSGHGMCALTSAHRSQICCEGASSSSWIRKHQPCCQHLHISHCTIKPSSCMTTQIHRIHTLTARVFCSQAIYTWHTSWKPHAHLTIKASSSAELVNCEPVVLTALSSAASGTRWVKIHVKCNLKDQ